MAGYRSPKSLREFTELTAEEVFADWVVANYFLDARSGYGYRGLEDDLTPPQPSAGLNSFPATHKGELPQYATDYISVDVRGADQLYLRLWQENDARLIPASAFEGDSFAYAIASDYGNSHLTRAFLLTAPRQAWLEYRVWFDLDEDGEYGYITISDDGGRSWKALRGSSTRQSIIYDDYYDYGYTGRSYHWKRERIDLSDYTPGRILIRFELISNFSTSYHGMAVDDFRIPAINYHEGFETADENWIAEGWIRTDNRLPNNTWLQVVQDTGDQLHLSRELVTGNGELAVDLLPGVSQALVAVSPVVPLTSLPAEYELEAYLMNAAGEVMVVTRDCSVTTTHALNFRAAPSGSKIGLLREGTTVDALDRQDDWFQVEYNGVQGWIHGDYVTEAGNCP